MTRAPTEPARLRHLARSSPLTGQSRLAVLRLILAGGHTSAPYHQFTLAARSWQDTTLCSFYPIGDVPPPDVDIRTGTGRLAPYLRLVRRVSREKPFDVVHCHAPHVAAMFVAAVPRRHRPPAVMTVHCAYSNFKFRNRLLLAMAMTGMDHVVYCSRSSFESMPRWLRTRVPHSIIPNGVDLARVDRAIRSPGKGPSESIELISVGRLIRSKNPLALVRAVAALGRRDVRLTFVGDGALADATLAEARRLGVSDRTTVTGTLPRDEVFERLARADVFVSASSREGLPVAVLEAMACGCPVVLSDIPPHREILAGREDCGMLASSDVVSLAGRLRRLCDLAPGDRANLGQNGSEHVRRHFSLDAMHRRYNQLFAQLMR